MSTQEKFSIADTNKAIDLSHHISENAKARKISPLKDIQKYHGRPGLISLAGGTYLRYCSRRSLLIEGIGGYTRDARPILFSLRVHFGRRSCSKCISSYQAFPIFPLQLVLEHLWHLHRENRPFYHPQVWTTG